MQAVKGRKEGRKEGFNRALLDLCSAVQCCVLTRGPCVCVLTTPLTNRICGGGYKRKLCGDSSVSPGAGTIINNSNNNKERREIARKQESKRGHTHSLT